MAAPRLKPMPRQSLAAPSDCLAIRKERVQVALILPEGLVRAEALALQAPAHRSLRSQRASKSKATHRRSLNCARTGDAGSLRPYDFPKTQSAVACRMGRIPQLVPGRE